jgi:hypothetical protein
MKETHNQTTDDQSKAESERDPLGFSAQQKHLHVPDDSIESATEECAQAKLHLYADQEHQKDEFAKHHPVITQVKNSIEKLWSKKG